MMALAWPFVALVLGLAALRVAWVAVVVGRRDVAALAAQLGQARADIHATAGIVDAERGKLRDLDARVVALQDWRIALRNRNGGRD